MHKNIKTLIIINLQKTDFTVSQNYKKHFSYKKYFQLEIGFCSIIR